MDEAKMMVDKEIPIEHADKEKEEEDEDEDDELQLSDKRVILSDDECDYVPEYYRNQPFQSDNAIHSQLNQQNDESTRNINSIQDGKDRDQNGAQLQAQGENPTSNKLTIQLNSDLLEESYMQKELVENLEEFSPIARMEDSRADVTAQLFDLSIVNAKRKNSSNTSSFAASKSQYGQIEATQQQYQQQGHSGKQVDLKNQKLRERFEKYSSQMKNNITNKNKSDSVMRQSQNLKGNNAKQETMTTPSESQQQQNAGNMENMSRDQLRQQSRQLSLSNYSKPTVSSQQKQEAPKTERIPSASKIRQKISQPPLIQKNSKPTLNAQQRQGQKHPIVLQESTQQQQPEKRIIPSSSSLSPSRRKQKNLSSREDYEVASKIRPSSQRASPSRKQYQGTFGEEQWGRNSDSMKVSKPREVQQYLEDAGGKSKVGLREDEGKLSSQVSHSISGKDQGDVEEIGSQKYHEECESEGLEINIYKQEERLKKTTCKGDCDEQSDQHLCDDHVPQDQFRRSECDNRKVKQESLSQIENTSPTELNENDKLQGDDIDSHNASILESKRIESQNNKADEQSDNLNNNPLSNRNRNTVQFEEQVILPDKTSSPLKTGIIPRILNFQQLIDCNNSSNLRDSHVIKTGENACASQSAKHIPIPDVKDHSGCDGFKSARISSTRTKKDLNVVTKGTSSKDISAKSSPRQDHSTTCSFKKTNSIFSPVKKASLNMVYLTKEDHTKPQAIDSGGKQSLQSSSSRNNQQKYFIDLEVQNSKKDWQHQKDSETSASISKQMNSNTNNVNLSQQSVVMSPTPRGQYKQSLHRIAFQICDQQKIAKQQSIIQLKNAGTTSSCSTSTSQNPQNSRNTPSNSISSAKQIFEEENNKLKIDLTEVGGGNQPKELQAQSVPAAAVVVKSVINPQGIPQLAQQQIMQLQIQQNNQNSITQPTYYAQQFQQKQAGKGVAQTPKDIVSYKKEQSLRKSSDVKIQQEYDVIDKVAGVAAVATATRKGNNGNLRGSTKDQSESFQRILSLSKNVRESNTSINKQQLFNQNSFLTDSNPNNGSELKTLQNFFHSNSEVYGGNSSRNNNTGRNGVVDNMKSLEVQQQQQPTETVSQQQRQAYSQNVSKTERLSNATGNQFYQGSFVQSSSTQNGFSKQNTANSNNCRNQLSYQSDISVSSSSRGYCPQSHYQNGYGQIQKHHMNSMEDQISQLPTGLGIQAGNNIEKQAKSIQKVLNSCLQPASLTARTSQPFQTYSSRESANRSSNTNNYSKVKNRSEVNVDHIVQHLLDVNKLSSNQQSSRQAGNSSGIGLHSRQNKSAATNTSTQNNTTSNGNKNYEALRQSLQKYTKYLKQNDREDKKQVVAPQVLSDIERDQLNYKIQQAEQEIARISKLRKRYSAENSQLEAQNEFLRTENQK